ncbi:hypothetical protein P43SY_001178 [Pythium insidiosum]|uniref:SWIRM domain-containing protein n=1 Tax=Pythium insidiosum TaxID=114742 RepID=A0AAD5Q5G3_PYTIN|nr:hypothetical protein P43SY_001178 [Pythium insidiosum]
MDKINPIEKRMLPEFFVNEEMHRNIPPGAKLPSSKTPQIYMKYRNYMVQAYRQQPHVYLTATACRRNLAGDACAIMRVHEFLTHWGLINYNVPPHAMPPTIHPNYSLKPAVASSTPSSSSEPLAVLVSQRDAAGGRVSANDVETPLCELCGSNPVAFELTADAKRKFGVVTSAPGQVVMPGTIKDMPLGSFGVRPGSGICDDCYLARSFPDTVDATDFTRLSVHAAWSKEEDALLIDAVSASTRTSQEACDWNQIAGKVKTKTAEDCVLRFLEMPLLHGLAERPVSSALRAPSFEYAESLNAPIADMATLVRAVDPFVAKAAARAAVQAVKELHRLPPREATQSVKQEGSDEKPDVEMANGDANVVQDAAASVASSTEAAGLASVKQEPGANDKSGDVEMASSSEPVAVTKEMVAVVHEAAAATGAAVLATRAHTIASNTAQGPIRDLVTELLKNQVAQLELKMQQLQVLEKAVAAERETLTKERHQLYMERLSLAQQRLGGSNGAT